MYKLPQEAQLKNGGMKRKTMTSKRKLNVGCLFTHKLLMIEAISDILGER